MKFKLPTVILICTTLLITACGANSPTTAPQAAIRTPIKVATFPPTFTPAPTHTPLPSSTPRPEPTSLLPTATPTLADPVSAVQAYLQMITERDQFSGAVLVSLDGEILIREGYGLASHEPEIPVSAETGFRISSLTQTFTAMGVMILQERQQIDIQEPVCIYISDCPDAWQSISTENLLLHTSGITEITSLEGYTNTLHSPTSPQELVDRFRSLPLDFEPGATWRYSNSNYILLGYLIAQVSGQSYFDFIQSNILLPLGMNASGFFPPAGDGLAKGYTRSGIDWVALTPTDPTVSYASMGMYSTIDDLYAWDQALASNQLVSQGTLDEIFTAHRSSAFGGVGYGWFIDRANNRTVIRHAGTLDGYTATIARYPEERLTVILLANRQNVAANVIVDRIARDLFRNN